MAKPIPSARRLCPTRPDGAHSLIAQSITPAVCLQRQRSHYHKCFACQYQGLSAEVILPALAHEEFGQKVAEKPAVAPQRPKVSKAM